MEPDLHILLVEDDDIDAFIANNMLSSYCKNCRITRFENGQEAIDYLKDENLTTQMVIVLDINMPLMNGMEFITEINKSEKLKKLTITILSSSSNPSDISFFKNFGIDNFYIKPLTEISCNEIIELAKVA